MESLVKHESFRSLLYRYLFHEWLFRDVSRGNTWVRSAAWRHNREQARWLPTYMRRWGFITVSLFGLAAFVEAVLRLPVLSACFYVPSVLAVARNAVTAVCWIFLRS